MGRPSNKQERRSEIVRAMMEVMAVKGYEGASIQAVAKQAGLTPGLIHYHFQTKQAILLESVNQLSDVLKKRYEALAERSKTPGDKLKAFINARLSKGEGANHQAVAAWVMIGSEAVRQPEVKLVYLAALKEQKALLEELLSDYFRLVLKKNALKKKELESKVAFVMAFMEGAFLLSVSASEIMPENWAAEALLTQLV